MASAVRLEPTLIELEREKEDLLIIGHASVIRCILAYLIGLPASEIPAIEVARGDLIEVVPTSYGVYSQAHHFWDGPGRRVGDVADGGQNDDNFYENYAEDTKGKRKLTSDESAAAGVPQIVQEAPRAQAMTETSGPKVVVTTDEGPVSDAAVVTGEPETY